MNQLALSLPQATPIQSPAGFKFSGANLSTVLSSFVNVIFLIAGFLMVFWFAWGVFEYIYAGGNKEKLAKARTRITWAIIGFLLYVVFFAISQYLQQVFPIQQVQVTPITMPRP